MPLELVNGSPRKKPFLRAADVVALQENKREVSRALDSFRGVDAFANIAARTGFGSRNLLEATQYPLTRLTRNYLLMNSLYRSNWIVRKVVDAMAEDLTKNWIKIISETEPKQLQRLEKKVDDTDTVGKILEGLKWGRLYGGAGAVIVIDGDQDKLDEPLDVEEVLPATYKGLLTFDRWSGITPSAKINSDVNRPLDFGLPESYRVTTETGQAFDVHCSRVLRFIGRPLPNWEKQAEQYWGESEIEVFFEELKKRDNTSFNIASLIFRANIFALKQKDLSQLLSGLGASPEAQRRFLSSIQAMTDLMSNQGLVVLPEDGSIETHQYSFGGINDIYQSFMLDICGATEYPMSRLFGRSSSGLSGTSEGDEHAYYELISQKQKRELEPQLKKLLPVIAMSVWGEVPDDFKWLYNPVRSMSNEEQADNAAKKTTAIVEVYNAGLIGRKTSLMELRQQADETNLFSNISQETIDEADDEPVAAGEMGMPGEPGAMGGEGGQEPGGEGGEDGGKEEGGKPDPGKEIPATPNSKPRKQKGNDKALVIPFQGLELTIENDTGSTRSGVDPITGKKWSVKMSAPYGYINGTEGVDGDAVDCFVGPNPFAETAFVIHALRPGTFGQYDEDKVMLGFSTAQEAKQCFLDNYTDPKFFGSLEMVPMVRLYGKLRTQRAQMLQAMDRVGSIDNHSQLEGGNAALDRIIRRYRDQAAEAGIDALIASGLTRAQAVDAMGNFEEREHPRKRDGKFAPKGQGESGASESGSEQAPSRQTKVPRAASARTEKQGERNENQGGGSEKQGEGKAAEPTAQPTTVNAAKAERDRQSSGGEFTIPGTGQKFSISAEPELRAQQLAKIREEGFAMLAPNVREGLLAGKGTNEIFEKDGKYSPERVQLHQRIIDSYFKGKKPQKNPKLIFVGGGSASGKTTASDEAAEILQHDSVDLNVDEIRPLMPEYGAVVGSLNIGRLNEEAGYIRDMIIAKAIDGKYNMALDGTGGGSAVTALEEADKGGFQTSFFYVHRPSAEAAAAAVARASRTKNISDLREMKPEWVEDIHDKARGNFEKMATPNREVKVYDKSDPSFGKQGKVVFWRMPNGEVKVNDAEGVKRVEQGGRVKFKIK